MKLNVPYKVLCDIDLNLIEDIKNTIDENDWYANDARNYMQNLEKTQSILIRYFDDYSKVDEINWQSRLVNYSMHEKYKLLIDRVLTQIKENTDIKIKEYLCFFARLAPNSEVGVHKDGGNFLETCHRIHIPIVTHPECKYIIQNIEYHWECGKVYEFDNTRQHGVDNRSSIWRTHLMVNIYE
jgi:hypothetical protein